MSIRADETIMLDTAGTMHNNAATIGDVIASLSTCVDNLLGTWEGQASQAFAEQFAQIKPIFESTQEMVDSVARQVEQAAANYSDLDSSMAGQFGV